MHAVADTAGERVDLTCSHRWAGRVLGEGLAGQSPSAEDGEASVTVEVESDAAPFQTRGWEVLTRGAYRRPGQVLLRNACSSGLDLVISTDSPDLRITARWRPERAGRVAASVLRSRARLLIRAVLLQYPALWRAQLRQRAVVHASACTIGGPAGRTAVLAGPGGVGKSTLVDAELADGGRATADNLCVTDGETVWGVLEPRRVPAERGSGRRMPHGRREAPWQARPPLLTPDLVIVLRRGTGDQPSIAECDTREAARALAAGTYMAGELRRYWPFAATLALGSGQGEVRAPVEEVTARLCARLPCVQVTLARQPGADIRSLLSAFLGLEVRAWHSD